MIACASLLGRGFRQGVDAEDVLQSVFLKIHQKLSSLKNEQRLEAWVFQIARNAIVDHLRKGQHDGNGVEEVAAEPPDDRGARTEVSRCIRALIEGLPAPQKRAVLLYELKGLPQATIAQQESISLSAAKSRVQRGRKRVKDLLEECCRFQFDVRGNVLDYESNGDSCESNCDCGDSCD